MDKKDKFVLKENWVYPLYIIMACVVTSALNVLHTKYILGQELKLALFYVPIAAGIIFGYATAKIRIGTDIVLYHSDIRIFIHYILLACLVTSALNVIHTEWVLGQDLKLVLFVAPLLAGVFFGYLLARIKTLNSRLTRLATTDVLTNTFNRMHFDYVLKMEIDKVKRYGGKFSIIFFDIDHFKNINDKHGHGTGDSVLVELSELVKEHCRCTDIFSRYGGEEFVILANATDLEGATKCADHLCEIMQLHTFRVVKKVTCSFGVAEFNKNQLTPIIELADKALYNAKKKGRNRVEVM